MVGHGRAHGLRAAQDRREPEAPGAPARQRLATWTSRDWMVVIGNPFGLGHSVSVGVVSFKGRTDVTPNGLEGYFDYMQTDAAINPGNSGGPVLDINGNVVAIANAVNVSGQGIGFAVPMDIAKAVLPQLIQHGQGAPGLGGHLRRRTSRRSGRHLRGSNADARGVGLGRDRRQPRARSAGLQRAATSSSRSTTCAPPCRRAPWRVSTSAWQVVRRAAPARSRRSAPDAGRQPTTWPAEATGVEPLVTIVRLGGGRSPRSPAVARRAGRAVLGPPEARAGLGEGSGSTDRDRLSRALVRALEASRGRVGTAVRRRAGDSRRSPPMP